MGDLVNPAEAQAGLRAHLVLVNAQEFIKPRTAGGEQSEQGDEYQSRRPPRKSLIYKRSAVWQGK